MNIKENITWEQYKQSLDPTTRSGSQLRGSEPEPQPPSHTAASMLIPIIKLGEYRPGARPREVRPIRRLLHADEGRQRQRRRHHRPSTSASASCSARAATSPAAAPSHRSWRSPCSTSRGRRVTMRVFARIRVDAYAASPRASGARSWSSWRSCCPCCCLLLATTAEFGRFFHTYTTLDEGNALGSALPDDCARRTAATTRRPRTSSSTATPRARATQSSTGFRPRKSTITREGGVGLRPGCTSA